MLVCHSYVFFGYVSVKIFDLFCFIVLFVFLLASFREFLSGGCWERDGLGVGDKQIQTII